MSSCPPETEGEEIELFVAPLGRTTGVVESGRADFKFANCPAGVVEVSLHASFGQIYYPGTLDRRAERYLEVQEGETLRRTLDLLHPARVRGRYLGSGEVRLSLFGVAWPFGLGYLRVGADGTFDQLFYFEGAVHVYGSTGGPRLTDAAGIPQEFWLAPDMITEIEVPDWDLRMSLDLPSWVDETRLVATFIDDRGEDFSRSWNGTTSPLFAFVPPGRYRIKLEPSRCREPWIRTWWPGVWSEDEAQVIEVTSDPSSRELQLEPVWGGTLEAWVRTRGTTRGATGQVFLRREGETQDHCSDGSARPDGRIFFQGVEPGRYHLGRSLGNVLSWYPGVDSQDDATPIVFGLGEAIDGIEFWIDE